VQVTGGTLVAGRSFTAMEYAASAYVAVINEPMAEAFFSGVDPIGKTIKVFGVPFTVIGVWVQADVMFGNNDRPRLAIPHTTFTKVADYWKGWMEFSVIPTETATVQEAQDQVVAALRAKRGLKPNEDNTFDVVGQDKLLDSFNSITRVFFLVMLALSGVGLMVGGVGVVAIMMISVTERTREIGVRKALGATRAEIMFQFLVEAATLTVVGGAAGLVLGGLITLGVNKWTPIPAAIPLWSVAVALIASVITGVFFGLYPANRASKLDPVEALRYE
jgi:putative ABC transport system permease protein